MPWFSRRVAYTVTVKSQSMHGGKGSSLFLRITAFRDILGECQRRVDAMVSEKQEAATQSLRPLPTNENSAVTFVVANSWNCCIRRRLQEMFSEQVEVKGKFDAIAPARLSKLHVRG
jgi:hypothetical protein